MEISILDDHRGELEAHRSDCQDIQHKRNSDPLIDVLPLGEHENHHEAWEEYNIDFIQEAEELGTPVEGSTWSIDFYPCTGWDNKGYNG